MFILLASVSALAQTNGDKATAEQKSLNTEREMTLPERVGVDTADALALPQTVKLRQDYMIPMMKENPANPANPVT